MKTETLLVASQFDGTPLSILLTLPEETPRALVQFSHGMSEYKERYLPFMEFLTAQGFACVINDHRGHGHSVRSERDLGWFGAKGQGAEGLLQDLRQVTELFTARFPGLPLLLFGHSMGSLAARCYARRWDDRLNGLIVCGCPGYNPGVTFGRAYCHVLTALGAQKHKSPLLASLMFGTFNRMAGGHGLNGWICRDPATVAAYNKDPLCGFVFTINGLESLFDLMVECYTDSGWQMANPSMPIHFISGGDDPCRVSDARFAAAGEHLRRRGYRQVTQKLYPGLRHEILNEGEMQVWRDAADTLLGFTGAPAEPLR